jgi:hypothetical protein
MWPEKGQMAPFGHSLLLAMPEEKPKNFGIYLACEFGEEK